MRIKVSHKPVSYELFFKKSETMMLVFCCRLKFRMSEAENVFYQS